MEQDDRPISKEQIARLLQCMRDAGAERLPPGVEASEAGLAPLREYMAFLQQAAAPETPAITKGDLWAAKMKLHQALHSTERRA